MPKAKKQNSTITYFDPRKVDRAEFILSVKGDCMSPEIGDGSPIIIHRDVKPKMGELAAIFFKPAAIKPGSIQIALKRLVAGVPNLKKTNSTGLAPCIICEDNKGRTYVYDFEKILAVCKVSLPDDRTMPVMSSVPKSALLKQRRRAA